MLSASVGILLLALAAARFPEAPLLAFLPAVAGTALAAVTPRGRGAWRAGLLAAGFLTWLPGNLILALATALLPAAVSFARGRLPVRTAGFALATLPAATYLAASAAARSFALPLQYPLDLCAALVIGATLSSLAYAPLQRERFGTRGRA